MCAARNSIYLSRVSQGPNRTFLSFGLKLLEVKSLEFLARTLSFSSLSRRQQLVKQEIKPPANLWLFPYQLFQACEKGKRNVRAKVCEARSWLGSSSGTPSRKLAEAPGSFCWICVIISCQQKGSMGAQNVFTFTNRT